MIGNVKYDSKSGPKEGDITKGNSCKYICVIQLAEAWLGPSSGWSVVFDAAICQAGIEAVRAAGTSGDDG